MKKLIFVCFAMISACVCTATSQRAAPNPPQFDNLPRHGVIGLRVGPRDTSRPENPQTNPPMVQIVAPGGAGEAAGFKVGDVIIALDGVPATTAVEFAHDISKRIAGSTAHIRISRAGKEMVLDTVLKPRPPESAPFAEVFYASVTVEGSRRRTIVTRPKTTGRHPAVLLIEGLGCDSVDGALTLPTVYGPILTALGQNNFVTARVEKSGQGDSEGPACTDPQSDANREAAGYLAELQALKRYDFVDPDKIFIFAHSLGPLVNAIVLPQEQIRGFIAAETVGRSWYEYGLENVRRQATLIGEPLDQVDRDVMDHARCASAFYLDHKTSDEVAHMSDTCAAMIHSYAGMPYTLMQQVGDLNLAQQWKQVNLSVLVIYGTSDPVTSADEGRYLVDLINSFHPGRASYAEIPGMGHDFARYASQLEYLNRRTDTKPHPFDDEVVSAMLAWLNQHLDSQSMRGVVRSPERRAKSRRRIQAIKLRPTTLLGGTLTVPSSSRPSW